MASDPPSAGPLESVKAPGGDEPERRTVSDLRDEARKALQDLLTDEVAPQLDILRPIGRGSAATVFLAREPALRRLVAVKVMSPDLAHDPKGRLRFEREAQTAARIAHPNVVTVFWVGALSDGLPYIAMQYIEGRSLEDRLRAEGRLEENEVRRILADLGSGLAAAHRKRIVHRDVKPANVLYEEETGRVFLTDFGIAAILATGDEEITQLTTAGHVLGDLRYVSPEALRGEELTEFADVYSLGLLGFELVTGEGPYPHGSKADLIAAHLGTKPRRARELRPDVDPELDRLLARMLDKIPAHRPSAVDLARHLAPQAGEVEEPDDDLPADVEAEEPLQEAAASGVATEVPASLDPPPDHIILRTLGDMDLTGLDGNRVLSILAQPKRAALLAYLAIGSHRGFKRRDTLLGVFWPEMSDERARHALRQALYILRRGLSADIVLTRGDEDVGVNPELLWCDAVAFEAAIAAGRSEEALARYPAELLPGFYASDAPEFERWLESQRQRIRRRASDAAWVLAAEREAEGNAPEAGRFARQAMDFAPFDETSVCRLIELLDRLGDRAGAIQAYDLFARLLASEYEAEPAPETRALIRRIRERESVE